MDNPEQQKRLRQVESDRKELLGVVDALVDVAYGEATSNASLQAALDPLLAQLRKFKGELRTGSALFGTSLDRRLMRALGADDAPKSSASIRARKVPSDGINERAPVGSKRVSAEAADTLSDEPPVATELPVEAAEAEDIEDDADNAATDERSEVDKYAEDNNETSPTAAAAQNNRQQSTSVPAAAAAAPAAQSDEDGDDSSDADDRKASRRPAIPLSDSEPDSDEPDREPDRVDEPETSAEAGSTTRRRSKYTWD